MKIVMRNEVITECSCCHTLLELTESLRKYLALEHDTRQTQDATREEETHRDVPAVPRKQRYRLFWLLSKGRYSQ